jgi:tagaturonate reductase
MSIALNSMSKFETRDLPTILEYVKRNSKIPRGLAFSLAALIEFYKGKRGKEEIKLADDENILEFYKNLWAKCDGSQKTLKAIVTTVLGYEKNWKMNLNEIPGLNDVVSEYLLDIEKVGIREAIKKFMQE